jgi:quercetin dioxygenase-like cupin family protein
VLACGTVQRWHLPSIEANGRREPRVLFSRPECRAVLIDLNAGDEMGDHRTHEQAMLEVVSGRIALTTGERQVECEAGTLVALEPGERRSIQAFEASRLLLVLAPWPGEGHYAEGEDANPLRMPSDATVPPLP